MCLEFFFLELPLQGLQRQPCDWLQPAW